MGVGEAGEGRSARLESALGERGLLLFVAAAHLTPGSGHHGVVDADGVLEVLGGAQADDEGRAGRAIEFDAVEHRKRLVHVARQRTLLDHLQAGLAGGLHAHGAHEAEHPGRPAGGLNGQRPRQRVHRMLLNVGVLPGHALHQVEGLVELAAAGADRDEDVVHLVGRRDALLKRLLVEPEGACDVSLLLACNEEAAIGDVGERHAGPPHLVGQIKGQRQGLVVAVAHGGVDERRVENGVGCDSRRPQAVENGLGRGGVPHRGKRVQQRAERLLGGRESGACHLPVQIERRIDVLGAPEEVKHGIVGDHVGLGAL